MKKTLLPAIICAMTAISPLLGQAHTQSLSLSNPGPLSNAGQTFTVHVELTFGGYNSYGLSYWLEVPNALAPFLSITGASYFTFPDPIQTSPNPAPFNSTSGSTPGFMNETRDLGATIDDPNIRPPCNCSSTITNLTFMLAPGAPVGNFTLRSTTVSPRISKVTDTDFNDNNLPAASVTLNIVPEPSILALLALSAGFVPMVIRRMARK